MIVLLIRTFALTRHAPGLSLLLQYTSGIVPHSKLPIRLILSFPPSFPLCFYYSITLIKSQVYFVTTPYHPPFTKTLPKKQDFAGQKYRARRERQTPPLCALWQETVKEERET